MHRIQLAWETLRDQEMRLMYDQRLNEQALQMKSFTYDEVPMCEFEVYDLEGGHREYRLSCRCSGEFIIDQEDIDCGFNLVVCTTCSARTLVSTE
jgi:diphthamide biosynthesis protein 4